MEFRLIHTFQCNDFQHAQFVADTLQGMTLAKEERLVEFAHAKTCGKVRCRGCLSVWSDAQKVVPIRIRSLEREGDWWSITERKRAFEDDLHAMMLVRTKDHGFVIINGAFCLEDKPLPTFSREFNLRYKKTLEELVGSTIRVADLSVVRGSREHELIRASTGPCGFICFSTLLDLAGTITPTERSKGDLLLEMMGLDFMPSQLAADYLLFPRIVLVRQPRPRIVLGGTWCSKNTMAIVRGNSVDWFAFGSELKASQKAKELIDCGDSIGDVEIDETLIPREA